MMKMMTKTVMHANKMVFPNDSKALSLIDIRKNHWY